MLLLWLGKISSDIKSIQKPVHSLNICVFNILQDGGAKLCVVDESNEHELFVYDVEKGRKLANTKVGIL